MITNDKTTELIIGVDFISTTITVALDEDVPTLKHRETDVFFRGLSVESKREGASRANLFVTGLRVDNIVLIKNARVDPSKLYDRFNCRVVPDYGSRQVAAQFTDYNPDFAVNFHFSFTPYW